MNKSKKIISIILALLFVVSIGTVMLISNAEDNSRDTSITVTVDKTELLTGESATVTVKATTNYAVGTMSIPVFYDKTLVEVSDGNAPLTDYANSAVTTDLTAADTSKIYANTGVDSSKHGFVLANYIAGAGTEVETMLTDAVVLTFKITAKADVKGEAVIKVVTESAKTESNIQGMLYFGAQPDGNTVNAIPENVEGIDVTNAVTIVNISNGENTLMVEEGFEYADYVVIDTNNTNNGEYTGIVYGIDTLDQNDYLEILATLDDALTTSNGDDYLVIEANEMGMESTGATITVVDENGDAIETYVFVYFGDIDGDGMISSNDALIAEWYEIAYEGIESYAAYVAADIDGDGMPTANDALIEEWYEIGYEGVDYQYNLGQNAVNNMYEWIY